MDIKGSFDPAAIEAGLYDQWEREEHFAPRGNGAPYCIVIPPPNITDRLHIGHAFQHTLMDALMRYHRMNGRRALWQTGTDHAQIATQMVVERQLLEQGITLEDIGREAFIDKVWDWKRTTGGNISRQIRRMGSSVDWRRERFTMDEGFSRAVIEVFVRLYDEGLDLSGQAAGQLGSGPQDLDLRSRGGQQRGGRPTLALPLPVGGRRQDCGRPRSRGRRHDPSRDHARRHRSCRASRRRTLSIPCGPGGDAPPGGAAHSGHRGRSRRPRVRFGLRQDHPGTRLRRQRHRHSARPGDGQHLRSRRHGQRQRAPQATAISTDSRHASAWWTTCARQDSWPRSRNTP